MRIRIPVSIAAAIGAAALLAGCSGGSSTPGSSSLPAASQSVVAAHNYAPNRTLQIPSSLALQPGENMKPYFPTINPDKGGKPTKYVGECGYYGSDCNVYSKGTVKYTLNGGNGLSNPQGTITDPGSGEWLIANTGASNIEIAKVAGSGKPKLGTPVSVSGQYPVDVSAIDKGKKIKCLVISNIFTTGGGSGSVTTQCGKVSTNLTYSSFTEGIGIAADSKGNCYWSGNGSTNGVVEFTGCKGSGTLLVSGLSFAGGVAFDSKGNMWYVDQSAFTVYSCTGTSSCVSAFTGFTDPLMINFSTDGKTLYVADAGSGAIDACTIGGSCSTYATRSTSDPPFGVAPMPGAI